MSYISVGLVLAKSLSLCVTGHSTMLAAIVGVGHLSHLLLSELALGC